MKKLLGLFLTIICLTGCFNKLEQGSALEDLPEKLEFFIKNHVHHFHFPTLEEFSPELLNHYYKTHPQVNHPGLAKADFSGDGLLDYAFILPLEDQDNILVIVNTIHSPDEEKGEKDSAFLFRFYYIGLVKTLADDYLTVKDNVLTKHSLNGDAVEIIWNQKNENYQLSKPLN